MRLRHLCFLGAALAGATVTVVVARGADAGTPLISPVVSLSFRGVADHTVEQGEPLSVAVRLSAPRHGTEAIEIAPATGAWTDAVSVEIAKDRSAPAVVKAAVVGRPDSPRTTLDRNRVAGGLWLFSGAAMEGLAAGDYVVRVRLKVDAGAGWTGETMSNVFPLKIVAPSAAWQRVTQRALSRANEAMLADRGEEAAGILDALLKTSPDTREVLVLRAVVAERAGNLPAALACVNRASSGLSASGPPPLDLHELRTRLQAKFIQPPAEGETFNPPAWSWPPQVVLAPAETPSGSETNSGAATTAADVRAAPPAPVAVAIPPAVHSPTLPPSSPATAGQSALASNVISAPAEGVVVPAAELDDQKIRADSAGQWAASATAGSQYGRAQYSAAKSTGAPDVPVVGNSPDAWCPAVRDEGMDWLELTFAKPVEAVEVRIRQSDAAGAMAKIEAIGTDGTTHLWWEGADPSVRPAIRDIVWFAVRVPKTAYRVARVKLTLNLASGPGYKQIDAVQLVSAEQDK